MDLINALVFFAFVINFFLLLLIHFRAQRSPANVWFELTALAISGWCLSMLFFRAELYLPLEIWAKLIYLFLALIPSFLLLFALYFPKDYVSGVVRVIVIGAASLMTLFILWGDSVIRHVYSPVGSEHIIIFGWGFYFIYILYVLSFFVLTYYTFLKKYVRQSSLRRMQMLYILLGTAVASIPALLTSILMPTFGYYELNWVGQVFTVCWVSGISYAVIRHRLIDLRIFTARAILYTILITILGVVYSAGIIVFGGLLFERMTQEAPFAVSLIMVVFISLTFQPLKRYLEKITNRFLYKDRYSPNKLLADLGQAATSTLDLTQLVDGVLEEFRTKVKPFYVSLIVIKDDLFYINKTVGEQQNVVFPEYKPEKIKKLLVTSVPELREQLLVYDEMEHETAEKTIMREYGIKLFLPLVVRDEVVGVLLLGDKSSGEIYTSEDIETFKILSSEVAVAIKNSLSYQEIVHFNQTLETKVKHATQNLQKANERLKELDKAKDEFVSIASHELRTPLTVIRSYMWMLLQNKAGKINTRQKEYLEHTFTAAERLIDLVNDMLNVARIAAGRLNVIKVQSDITNVLRNVIAGMSLRAHELSIKLTYTQSKKSIPKLDLDPEKIEQVVINLIGNSLKFTPEGGRIDVSVDYDREKKEVVVCVSDTGIGIRREDLNKLFHKFMSPSSDYTTRNANQSTGLGLYISRSIVRMHGGRMWADSDGEGKGSQFFFTLPIE